LNSLRTISQRKKQDHNDRNKTDQPNCKKATFPPGIPPEKALKIFPNIAQRNSSYGFVAMKF